MNRIAIIVIIFLTLLHIFGCKEAGGGAVRGFFSVAECQLEEAEIDLSIDYFTSDYFENTLTVRLQHTTQNYTFANGLLLEIRDVENAAAHLGEPIQVTLVPSLDEYKQTGPTTASGDEPGYPLTPYQGPARASLYLYDLCPESTVAFGDGEGTITFTHIYQPGKSDRIAGSFALEFIDPRTWQSPDNYGDHAEISGDFDFDHAENRSSNSGY